jgi:adenylate cyclase
MAVEIERKFLVRGEDWRKHATSRALLRQAHLARVCRLGAGCGGLMGLRHSSLIEKTRFTVRWQGSLWEVDVFSGDNSGLVIAEIELRHESENLRSPAVARHRGYRSVPVLQWLAAKTPAPPGGLHRHFRVAAS